MLTPSPLLGAVIGDIIGSVYEWDRIKTKTFPLFSEESDFTDDSVMSIAVADAMLSKKSFSATLHAWGRRYPGRGYGGAFAGWLATPRAKPYNSCGNGSAMRVSAVGCLCDTVDEVMERAKKSAEVSHNHPEGIKGAQATACAILLARQGTQIELIREFVIKEFGYDLDRTLAGIRPSYGFDETCQGTVPEAIIAFLESTDYEDAIRNAVSLGGDSDTLACITGSIAAAVYPIPEEIIEEAEKRLPPDMLVVLEKVGRRCSGDAER
jgi:ADP-ribosyl-[dinitrogen reductase] hydrolase